MTFGEIRTTNISTDKESSDYEIKVASILLLFVSHLKGLRLVNKAFGQYFQDLYVNYDRKLKLVMRLVELYKPYMLFKGMYVFFISIQFLD